MHEGGSMLLLSRAAAQSLSRGRKPTDTCRERIPKPRSGDIVTSLLNPTIANRSKPPSMPPLRGLRGALHGDPWADAHG